MSDVAQGSSEPVAWQAALDGGMVDYTPNKIVAARWIAEGLRVTALYASQPPAAPVETETRDNSKRPEAPHWERRWPHDQPNGWNLDADKFLALVKSSEGMMWLALGKAKYLELRVDTRDCGFNLYDRDGQPLNPDEVVEAVEKVKRDYGVGAKPHSPCSADNSELRKLQDIIDSQADQILDLHEVLKSAYALHEFIAGAYVLSLADFRYLNVVSTKIKAALPGGDVALNEPQTAPLTEAQMIKAGDELEYAAKAIFDVLSPGMPYTADDAFWYRKAARACLALTQEVPNLKATILGALRRADATFGPNPTSKTFLDFMAEEVASTLTRPQLGSGE